MSIQDRLREVRKSLGLTQTEFAEQMGITQTSLSMIESGHRQFNEQHIKVICSIFGVSEHWLRTGEGEMFESSPYEKDFMKIYEQLSSGTQDHLLGVAKSLLKAEEEITKNKQSDNIDEQE